eukprot:gene23843-28918_t
MCQATGGAAGLEQLGLSTSGIPSLRQLGLKEEKVNVIIASLVSAQPICTLHDVEKQLAAEEGVASFAELGLGPLLKQPLVQSLFQPATDLKAVPSITGLEVVMQLEEHMATNEKQARSGAPMARSWKRVEAVDLMESLVKSRGVASPSHLCVRIQKLGFYISNINKGRKQVAEYCKAVERKHKQEMQEMQLEERILAVHRREPNAQMEQKPVAEVGGRDELQLEDAAE